MAASSSPPVPAPSAQSPRTWRPMLLWSSVLILAAILGGAVSVFIIWRHQVESVLMDPGLTTDEAVEQLGGPVRAAAKLDYYLRLPERLAAYRYAAPDFLGTCGQPAIEPLIRSLDDRDEYLRERSALALGAIGPDAVSALLAAIQGRKALVRAGAARALGCIEPKAANAVPELTTLLSVPKVRKDAARALGNLGPVSSGAVPALTGMLDSPDVDDVEAAIAALGCIGPAARSALPRLQTLSAPGDPGDGCRSPALSAAAIDARWRITGDARQAIAELAEALKESGTYAYHLMETTGIGSNVQVGGKDVPVLFSRDSNPIALKSFRALSWEIATANADSGRLKVLGYLGPPLGAAECARAIKRRQDYQRKHRVGLAQFESDQREFLLLGWYLEAPFDELQTTGEDVPQAFKVVVRHTLEKADFADDDVDPRAFLLPAAGAEKKGRGEETPK